MVKKTIKQAACLKTECFMLDRILYYNVFRFSIPRFLYIISKKITLHIK